jgi:hypothetical protein
MPCHAHLMGVALMTSTPQQNRVAIAIAAAAEFAAIAPTLLFLLLLLLPSSGSPRLCGGGILVPAQRGLDLGVGGREDGV